MVSLSKSMGAAQIATYHQKEDYYTKDPGEWFGKGAEELGLRGEIDKAQFQAVAAGLDPRNPEEQLVAAHAKTDEKTGKVVEERRAGNDLTIHMSKSFSVLYAAAVVSGDQEMTNKLDMIWENTVKNTLAHVQANYQVTRVPDGRGGTTVQQTDNMVIGMFRHATNRNQDVHCHTHAVIFNATMDADGKWRANEPGAGGLYADQKLLSHISANEELIQSRAVGLSYDITNNNELYHQVRGVDKKSITMHSSRRAEIKAQVEEWRAEGKHEGMSHGELHDLANARTKEAKRDVSPEEILAGWKARFTGAGTTAEKIVANVRAEMEQKRLRENPDLNKTGAWMNETEADRERAKATREQEDQAKIQAEREEAEKNEPKYEDYWAVKYGNPLDNAFMPEAESTPVRAHEESGDGVHIIREMRGVMRNELYDAERHLERGLQGINEKASFQEKSDENSPQIAHQGGDGVAAKGVAPAVAEKAPNESPEEIYNRLGEAGAGGEDRQMQAARNAIMAAGEFISRGTDVFSRDRVTVLANELDKNLAPGLLDRVFDQMVVKSLEQIESGAGFVTYGRDRYSTAATYISERNFVDQVNSVKGFSLDENRVEAFLNGKLAGTLALSEAERGSLKEVGTSQAGVILTKRGIAQDTAKIDEGLQKLWSSEGLKTFTIRNNFNSAYENGYDNGWKIITTDHAQSGYFLSKGERAVCRIENAEKMKREDLSALIDKLQKHGAVKIELQVSDSPNFGAPAATDIIRKHSDAEAFKFEGEIKGKSEQLQTILKAADKKDFGTAAKAATYVESDNSLVTAVQAFGEQKAAGKSAVIVVGSPQMRFAANIAAHEKEVARNPWMRGLDGSGQLNVHVEITPKGDDRAVAGNYDQGWRISIGARGKGEALNGYISAIDLKKNTFMVSGTKADGSEFNQVINPEREKRDIKCWIDHKIEVSSGEKIFIGKDVKAVPVDFYVGSDRVRNARQDLAAAERRQEWRNVANVAYESRNRHRGHWRPKHDEQIKVTIKDRELSTIVKRGLLNAASLPKEAKEEVGSLIKDFGQQKIVSTGKTISYKPTRLHNSPYRSGVLAQPGVKVREGSILDSHFRAKTDYETGKPVAVQELSPGDYNVVRSQCGQVVVERNGNNFLLTNEKAEDIRHTYAKMAFQKIKPADSVVMVADPGNENSAAVLTAAATAAKGDLRIFTKNAEKTASELASLKREKESALDLPIKLEPKLTECDQTKDGLHSASPALAGATPEQQKTERPVLEKGEGSSVTAPVVEPAQGHTPTEKAILAGIEVVHETESIFHKSRAIDVAVKYAPGQHFATELNEAYASLVEKGEIVPLGNEKGRPTFSTPAMIEMERENISRLDKLSGAFQSHTTEAEVSEFIKKWESENFSLSAGQRDMVIRMQASDNGALAVQGDPGTGKTTATQVSVAFSREVLEPRGQGNYIIGMAYTGQAASELADALNRPASTVDKFLNSKIEAVEPGKVGQLQDPKTLFVPAGQNITVLCDESSFLGANRARQVLDARDRLESELGVSVKIAKIGDTKQRQSIAAGVDFKNSLEYSSADKVSLKDINRQKDDFSRGIARDLNIDNEKERGPAAQKAMDRMQDVGKLQELRSKLLPAAAVSTYLALQEQPKHYTEQGVKKKTELRDVAIAVETNRDRQTINELVRNARMERKELGETRTKEILTPMNTDNVKRGLASNWEKGLVVQFVGKEREDGSRSRQWKNIKTGTMAEVVSNDPTKNEVALCFTDSKGRKEVKNFPAHELRNVTALFQKEVRSISVGDKIVCLQNDKSKGVENGTRLDVAGFDKDGGIEATTSKGKRISLKDYNKLDIGYASTVDKLQGASVDACIYVSRHATHNSANVALTRGKFHNEVLTNSIENFKKGVTIIEDKADTVRKTEQLSRQARRESAVTQQRAPQAPNFSKPSEAAQSKELDAKTGKDPRKKLSTFTNGDISHGSPHRPNKADIKNGAIPGQGTGANCHLRRDDFDKPSSPSRITRDDFDKGTSAEKQPSRSHEISSPRKSKSLDLGR